MLNSPEKTEYTKCILSNREIMSMARWLKSHSKVCDKVDEEGALLFAIDQKSESGIGIGTDIRCSCGEKFDVTDYGTW
jgi:hypothetical protein